MHETKLSNKCEIKLQSWCTYYTYLSENTDLFQIKTSKKEWSHTPYNTLIYKKSIINIWDVSRTKMLVNNVEFTQKFLSHWLPSIFSNNRILNHFTRAVHQWMIWMINVKTVQFQSFKLIIQNSYFFDTIHKLNQRYPEQDFPECGPQTMCIIIIWNIW